MPPADAASFNRLDELPRSDDVSLGLRFQSQKTCLVYRLLRLTAALGVGIAGVATALTGCRGDVEHTVASVAPLPLSAEHASAMPPVAKTHPGAATALPIETAATKQRATPDPKAAGGSDRIYGRARFVWIQPAPRPTKGWLGYLTLGTSAQLKGNRETARVLGPGCDAWYRVEPEGFVCEGQEATLDPLDPIFADLARTRADVTSSYPFSYAESLGAPRYARPPNTAELARAEVVAPITQPTAGPELLAPLWDPELDWLSHTPLVREARHYVQQGSTIAFVRTLSHEGRSYLVTSDRMLVPRHRVKPYPVVSFEGIELDDKTRLPVAFFRAKDRPQYRRDASGQLVTTGQVFPRLSWAGLSGAQFRQGQDTFLETRQTGVFVRASDAAVATQRDDIPFEVGAKGRRSWLDISIGEGTLVAYEAQTPVFATLISPGRGGAPYPGIDPLKTASTPVGTFRIDGKFKTATMVSSSDANIVHSEVTFVQNFHGPHALHGAYWHDAWGEPKSGGCVNLSPRDAQRLFAWTDPQVPEDWHGMRSVPQRGPPTRVVVRR